MKWTVDTDTASVIVHDEGGARTIPLASPAAFEVISEAWLRAGWDVKYVYSFTWLGRPIIQLPEDMFRLQEIIYRLKPDVIIETGVAHGGALIFYAGLCKLMGKGRVIGIDIEIRAHNRAAIEQHDLFEFITMIEGSSTDDAIVDRARRLIVEGDVVLVLLDSNHSKSHVKAELDAFAPLVTLGSYIVAMDGIMSRLVGAPGSRPDWHENNPQQAALEWVREHSDYVIEEPPFSFNEGLVKSRVTYWPNAFLRRMR